MHHYKTMCMLKGVPLSTDDMNIEKDIERVHNNISVKRPYKNGKQFHTMLLTLLLRRNNPEPSKREYTSFPVEFCATAKD